MASEASARSPAMAAGYLIVAGILFGCARWPVLAMGMEPKAAAAE